MAGDNKQLDFRPADPFTRIDPKLNQVVPWSLHTFPESFTQIGPAVSLNLADKETNKETKKEIARKQYPVRPSPYRGRGKNEWTRVRVEQN